MGTFMTPVENPMGFLQVIPFVRCSAVVLPFNILFPLPMHQRGGVRPVTLSNKGKLLEAPNCLEKKVGT